MTPGPDSFDDLMRRVRAGDEQAILQLVQQYEAEVRMVARARLGRALRPYLDSVDLVQSVHRTILLGIRDEKFDVTSPDRLLGLAIIIVRRKVARQWRRAQRQHRPVEAMGDVDGLKEQFIATSDQSSDPAVRAARNDGLDCILRELNPTERQLIELRMAGHTTAESARQVDLNPDVARVVLSRLRKRLAELGLTAEVV